MTKKTQEKYDAILNAMQPDKWYKVSEFEDVADVKESRIKVLLKDLSEQGLIESIRIFLNMEEENVPLPEELLRGEILWQEGLKEGQLAAKGFALIRARD